MFKRLSVIAAVFFLLTVAFLNPALAKTYDATKAIDDAETNFGSYYDKSGKNNNGDALYYVSILGLKKITDASGNSYGFLSYGDEHGLENGHNRYIGYTFYGEDYTNMDFPADKNANGADFASQNWISQPWGNSPDAMAVKASDPTFSFFNPAGLPGDGDSQYHTAILAGIMAYGGTNANNGYTMNGTDDPSFGANVEQYVHILAPPTQYAWGVGRMWHTDASGTLFYVTVPLQPKAPLYAKCSGKTN